MDILIKRTPLYQKTHAIGKCEGQEGCGSVMREDKSKLPSWSERLVSMYGYGGTIECPVCNKLLYMYSYYSTKGSQLLKEVAEYSVKMS